MLEEPNEEWRVPQINGMYCYIERCSLQSYRTIDQGVALALVSFCSARANISKNGKESPDLMDAIMHWGNSELIHPSTSYEGRPHTISRA